MDNLASALMRILLAVGIFTCAMQTFGQQPGNAGSSETQADNPLATEQSSVTDRFKRLEDLLLRSSELEAGENPARAALLRQAAQLGKQAQLAELLAKATENLKNNQYSEAIEGQKLSRDNLKQLLELLQSENREERVREQRDQVRRWIEETDRLMRLQGSLRGRTEGGQDAKQASKDQERLAKKAAEIAADLGGDEDPKESSDGKDQAKQGKDASSDSQSAQDADKSPGKAGEKDSSGKKDGKESGEDKNSRGDPEEESTEGESTEKEPAGGEPKNGATKENASEKEPGERPEGEAGSDASQTSGEKSPQDASQADPSDSQDSQSDKGNANPNPSEPSQSQQQGQPQQGQSPQAQSQQGQGQSQEQAQQQQPEQQEPQTPTERAKARIKQAKKAMEEAQQELDNAKREGAIEKQREAEENLREAIEELEEILRQLREEEIERSLASLETRLRRMLEMEKKILEETTRLSEIAGDGKVARQVEIQASNLSLEQRKVLSEGERAYLLLRDEGSSAAFPEAMEQVNADIAKVADRLAEADVGPLTLLTEEDIVSALEEMVAALVQVQKDNKEKQQKQQQGQQPQGQPGEQPLVDKLAEIRLIRTLQQRINKRTEALSKMLENPEDAVGQSQSAEILEELRALSERELSIWGVTREIEK